MRRRRSRSDLEINWMTSPISLAPLEVREIACKMTISLQVELAFHSNFHQATDPGKCWLFGLMWAEVSGRYQSFQMGMLRFSRPNGGDDVGSRPPNGTAFGGGSLEAL